MIHPAPDRLLMIRGFLLYNKGTRVQRGDTSIDPFQKNILQPFINIIRRNSAKRTNDRRRIEAIPIAFTT